MRTRGVLAVAILAALVWAPSIASAATNVLDSPEAAPAIRTTSNVERGNSPRLTGPLLTVSAPKTATTQVPGHGGADGPPASEPGMGKHTVADDGAVPVDPTAFASVESDATAGDGLLDDAPWITAIWAAVLLAVGSLMLGVVVRRRRREAADAEALASAAETEALLKRRALRRAHVLMPDDPIVASMHLDETAPTSRGPERRRPRRRDREKR